MSHDQFEISIVVFYRFFTRNRSWYDFVFNRLWWPVVGTDTWTTLNAT